MTPIAKLYVFENSDAIYQPIAFTAIQEKGRGQVEAEWHLLNPEFDDADHLISRIILIDESIFHKGVTGRSLPEFLLDEAKNQILIELRIRSYKRNHANQKIELMVAPVLTDQPFETLYRYAMRGLCKTQLELICKRTYCSVLREKIEAINKYSPITWNSISDPIDHPGGTPM